jgi:hypothetical protein
MPAIFERRAINPAEEWARDLSQTIAREIIKIVDDRALTAGAPAFLLTHLTQSAQWSAYGIKQRAA